MKNFKIKSYGIDIANLRYRPEEKFEEEFIHISLRSGNSFLLEDKISEDTKIICTTEFLDGIGTCIDGLLEEIGRSEIEALLLGPGCNVEKYRTELRELLDKGIVRNVGISHPSNIVRLKDTAEKIKQLIIPRYLLLTINPVYFQKELIDWAETEGLTIIGDNPFGGFLDSGRTINSFSVPYLLGFSATYSDIVLLSSRDLITSGLEEEYLGELIGKECPEMYELEVSADHRVKPFKKMVHTSLRYFGHIVPYSDPLSIWNYSELELDFSKMTYKEPENEESLLGTIKSIYDYIISSIKYPEDGDQRDYLSCVRPELCRQLREAGYNTTLAQLGEEVYVLKITKELQEKRFLRKSKKLEITDFLLLTVSEGNLILKKTEMSKTLLG